MQLSATRSTGRWAADCHLVSNLLHACHAPEAAHIALSVFLEISMTCSDCKRDTVVCCGAGRAMTISTSCKPVEFDEAAAFSAGAAE